MINDIDVAVVNSQRSISFIKYVYSTTFHGVLINVSNLSDSDQNDDFGFKSLSSFVFYVQFQ